MTTVIYIVKTCELNSLLRTAKRASKSLWSTFKPRKTKMAQIHFTNIKEIPISYGDLGLYKKQFNFNKMTENKPGAYFASSIKIKIN